MNRRKFFTATASITAIGLGTVLFPSKVSLEKTEETPKDSPEFVKNMREMDSWSNEKWHELAFPT